MVSSWVTPPLLESSFMTNNSIESTMQKCARINMGANCATRSFHNIDELQFEVSVTQLTSLANVILVP